MLHVLNKIFLEAYLKSQTIIETEVCRIRSTGVDSGRSGRFSTGAGVGPGVDIFD